MLFVTPRVGGLQNAAGQPRGDQKGHQGACHDTDGHVERHGRHVGAHHAGDEGQRNERQYDGHGGQ